MSMTGSCFLGFLPGSSPLVMTWGSGPNLKAQKKAASEADRTEAPAAKTVFHTFAEAPFAPAIRGALEAAYSSPTPIQAEAWPVALTGRDLIAVATKQ